MKNIWPEVAVLLAASLILIASLAWADACGTWFFSLGWFSSPIIEKLFYAILATFVAALVLSWLQPFRNVKN